MDLKEIFEGAENGVLSYEQFQEIAKAKDAKFTDLNEGKYVAKRKYDDDIKSKDTQIDTLNGTISTRDADLVKLQKQLEDAGTDATKLTELNTKLANLQSQYDADTQNYQAQLSKQAYEFAVKEFAATKQFTSSAAKRDFISSMIAKNLPMDNSKIMGAEDFVTAYTADNEDAFKVEKAPSEPKPNPQPSFVQPTPGPNPTAPDNGFKFNFTGVRAHEA